MVTYQVKEKYWEQVYEHILTHGRTAPLSRQIDLDMTCNGVEYVVKIQPDKKQTLVALQAVSARPNSQAPYGKEYSLVQNNAVLSALLLVFIHQLYADIARSADSAG